MSPTRLITAVLALCLGGAPLAHAERIVWESASAVVAGVLVWDDADYADFERAKRQDKVFASALVKLGLPADRLALLLDRKAKHTTILENVARLAAATPQDGTFIFYFDGHGTRLDDGRIAFASSDVRSGKETTTALMLDELTDVIVRSFRGRRVLLLADCCHSGGLAKVARALRARGLDAVSLTSSEASNASTGEWTYTLALIDALTGRPLLDSNGNGQIELGELNTEVRSAMLYREQQRSGFDPGQAPLDLVIAPARKEPTPRAPRGFVVGEYAKTSDDDVVRVVGEEAREAVVETLDYATRDLATVDVSELSRLRFESFKAGSELQVVWEGKCYEAKVVRTDGAFHWITYPGWDASWDEWVADDRIISGTETCPTTK